LIFSIFAAGLISASDVRISGKRFKLNGQRIFLNGANQPWVWYDYDFGDGQWYKDPKAEYTRNMYELSRYGGNSMRFWLHPEGQMIPVFDRNGYVTGMDKKGSLISELNDMLDNAKQNNILVTIVLWNGAMQRTQNVLNLMTNTAKLQTYLDKFLVPVLNGIKNHPALFAVEVINELEGIVDAGKSNSEPCFDTTPLKGSGAGWDNKYVSMKNLLSFINRHAAVIKKTCGSKVLVTAGSWREHSNVDKWGDRNYYKDSCLRKAGGEQTGTLDFYQIHTYAWNGKFESSAPMNKKASDYGLDKPLVIGEFASVCSQKHTPQQMYKHFYEKDYDGAWAWEMHDDHSHCTDGKDKIFAGTLSIDGRTDHGKIKINL